MTDNMQPQYLAKRPGKCCTKGTLHNGEPRGAYQTIASVETYNVHPNEDQGNGNILLFFPDVMGMSVNNRLLMDSFANEGYIVHGINYFLDVKFILNPKTRPGPRLTWKQDPLEKHRLNGKLQPDFDFNAWVDKHVKSAETLVPKWITAVRDLYAGGKKFCCVGYCFGAQYVCNALGDGTAAVGAFAHPAFLTDEHFANIKGAWNKLVQGSRVEISSFNGEF